jgi:pescadillo protein
MGQKITYLTPYQYPPNLPMDVDYRVMSTFLEFY